MTARHELVFLAVLGLILGIVVCTAMCHRADIVSRAADRAVGL